MSKTSLDYKKAGINYGSIDPLKILAQKEGARTTSNLHDSYAEVTASRGESAYVVEAEDSYIAVVQEGLGTKNVVADEVYKATGTSHYDAVAQDTVAAIINDLITVGAAPLTLMAYWAAGSSEWFEDKKRAEDLVKGWGTACDMAGVVWGGGETPALPGIIEKNRIDLGGSAVGVIKPKERLTLGEGLTAGDAIVVFESSGIHANGLTLARKIAEQLPEGYATKVGNSTYGELLLVPGLIYSKLIQSLFDAGVDIHYMAHITGHGWRKLMRHSKNFTYRISSVPPVPEVLQFLQREAGMSDEEAYATFNMGAGYAVYVPESDVQKVLDIAASQQIKAYHVGTVEEGEKQIVIEPLNISYASESLQVRS